MRYLVICLAAMMLMLSGCAGQGNQAGIFAEPCCIGQCGKAAPVAPKKVEMVNLFENIMFDWDKSVIRKDMEPIIDKVAEIMLSNPDMKIGLDGYASLEGATDYNLKLSGRRVDAVASALEAKGVSSDRIINVVAQGETDLFGLELPKNRKVVIVSVD